jgi:hypothetical protein
MHPAYSIAVATANPPLIRPEDFRKNAVKFGWELLEANPSAPAAFEEEGHSQQLMRTTETTTMSQHE